VAILVTAVWRATVVQVKDAVALYPPLAGILVAEPAVADVLHRLIPTLR
jgi:hypothetical protein